MIYTSSKLTSDSNSQFFKPNQRWPISLLPTLPVSTIKLLPTLPVITNYTYRNHSSVNNLNFFQPYQYLEITFIPSITSINNLHFFTTLPVLSIYTYPHLTGVNLHHDNVISLEMCNSVEITGYIFSLANLLPLTYFEH